MVERAVPKVSLDSQVAKYQYGPHVRGIDKKLATSNSNSSFTSFLTFRFPSARNGFHAGRLKRCIKSVSVSKE
jgi:hypothetical protein